MSSEYPTQDYVKKLIAAGKWPAQEGEVLDINSLTDKQIKLIELYNQEEIIKQLRRVADGLAGEKKSTPSKKKSLVKRVIEDLSDDGKLNDSVED